MTLDKKCPRCGSPDPARHPAMQYEGEVQICPDLFHLGPSIATKIREAEAAGLLQWPLAVPSSEDAESI